MLSPEEITRKQQELSQKRAWKRMRRRRRLISGVFLCLFGLLLLTASAYVSYQIGLANEESLLLQVRFPRSLWNSNALISCFRDRQYGRRSFPDRHYSPCGP